MVNVKFNNEKNGIELYFDYTLSDNELQLLNAKGFRWSRYMKCWYAYQTPELIEFANELIKNIEFKVSKQSVEYKGLIYTNRSYSSNNYFIMRVASVYRIYNKKGQLIHSMNPGENLLAAKQFVIELESHNK